MRKVLLRAQAVTAGRDCRNGAEDGWGGDAGARTAVAGDRKMTGELDLEEEGHQAI